MTLFDVSTYSVHTERCTGTCVTYTSPIVVGLRLKMCPYGSAAPEVPCAAHLDTRVVGESVAESQKTCIRMYHTTHRTSHTNSTQQHTAHSTQHTTAYSTQHTTRSKSGKDSSLPSSASLTLKSVNPFSMARNTLSPHSAYPIEAQYSPE